MSRPLCIYHSPCLDGFGAAWVVRKFFGGEVDFHPGAYGQAPPDVRGRDIIMVDFSYKRPAINEMHGRDGGGCRSILILDHHKTAEADLAGFREPERGWSNHLQEVALDVYQNAPHPSIFASFDMSRSGAGLAWDYFFAGQPRPQLIDKIEDRDLWRFAFNDTRAINGTLFSYPYDFDVWDNLAQRLETDDGRSELVTEGLAIDRKMLKDIGEFLGFAQREMVIGGHKVPVVNLPYFMASEAAGQLAESAPFAAAYYDKGDARVFSLRSRKGGVDVAEIAKAYGGGGHAGAAGFQRPVGWEGDK